MAFGAAIFTSSPYIKNWKLVHLIISELQRRSFKRMISALYSLTHVYLPAAGFAKTWKMFRKDLNRNVFPQFVGPAINMLRSISTCPWKQQLT